MIPDLDLTKLTINEKRRILELYRHQEQYAQYNNIDKYYATPEIRQAYAKHMEFFRAGAKHKERMILAANRTGKSLSSCYEIVMHATGSYESWWEGKRLTEPQDWWICGENNNLLRDSIIETLLGKTGSFGTGLFRHKDLVHESITDTTKTSTTINSLLVRHKSGKNVKISFKTYEMGRESYQASKVCVLFDEEPPLDIYSEALTRTATLGDDGIIIMNFTPLKGMGPLLVNFLEGKAISTGPISKFRHLTTYTWDDIPHLSEEVKQSLIMAYPPYMRDARTKGLPVMGEGAVYPISEDSVFIDPLPFAIPEHWRKVGAMDFGWTDPTVVLWFAIDPDGGTVYQYAEHYLSEGNVNTHAGAIKAQWKLAGYQIPIVCDPSGGGRSIADGTQTRTMYSTQHDITMISAGNSIEVGIAKVFAAMTSGKLKIYKTCVNTLKEFRSYSRYKNGFKGDDHCLVPGTLVTTSNGDIAIEMVKVGDLVLTRAGYKPVLWSGVSGNWMDTYTVTTKSGRTVTATGNHKILTNKGWMEVSEIDKYLKASIKQQCQPLLLTTESSSLKLENITEAHEIINLKEKYCSTDKFGLMQMVPFHLITVFTTLTTILSTTISAISNVLQKLLTISTTKIQSLMSTDRSCELISISNVTLPKNGMLVTKEKNGIVCMPSVMDLEQDKVLKLYVLDAEKSLLLSPHDQQFPAAQVSAEQDFYVQDEVVSVQYKALSPVVYDLTVEEQHEFFADGIIVHNCMDCLKYCFMTGVDSAKNKAEIEALLHPPEEQYTFINHNSSDSWMMS